MKWSKNFFLFSAIVLVALSPMVLSQGTTGTIQGAVKDEQGAIIPGVEVTIRSLDTGARRMVISNDTGRYSATNLALGSYEVRAELTGFQTTVRTGITVTVGRVAVVDLTLTIGELAQEMVVTGEAPLVETTQSSVSSLVDQRQIRDLPLNVRSYAELATLQLGVSKTTTIAGGQNNAGTGYGTQLTFAGSRPDSNNFLLDGSDINNAYNKAPNSGSGGIIGIEAVREFEVKTSTYSAEYGRSMGGVVNAVTRSGTNAFHGSIYEFHRNDNLDARNFFDRDPENPTVRSDPPEFRRNQFGFSLGGPIATDKTFIFGNYEGFRESLGLTRTINVPDEQARLGIIPGEAPIVVAEQVKPYLANHDIYPLPTPGGINNEDGTAEHVYEQAQITDEDFFLIRFDHHFSQNDSFFTRYSFNEGKRLFGGHPSFRRSVEARNQFTTLEEKHIFSPVLLNTLRFSFNRNINDQPEPPLVDIPSELWFNDQGVTFGLEPLGSISISGSTSGTGTYNFNPKEFTLNVFELSDDINYTSGNHSLKFGLIAKRWQLNMHSGLDLRGRYSFRGLPQFLRGEAREFRSQAPGSDGVRGLRQNLFGFYVQDNYAVRPGLTLNLGLRYEFVTVPTEVNGKLANHHNLLDAETTVGPPWENPSLNNFAPRIGFSWDPFGDGRTAIRAGYGIFYDQILFSYYHFVLSRTPPFMKNAFIRNTVFPDAFELIEAGDFTVRNSLHSMHGDTAQPYLQQWNFSMERELFPGASLAVGYMGSRGNHLGRLVDNVAYSELLPDGRRWIPLEIDGVPNREERRNPNFAEIRQRRQDATSFYNAFMMSFLKRFSGGNSAQISYTISKSIDDASVNQGAGDTNGAGNQWSNLPEAPAFDRGPSLFDTRHNFVFNNTLELPFGPGRAIGADLTGFAGVLVGGWKLSSILQLATGSPFLGELNIDRALSESDDAQRPDLVPGRSNNPILGGADQYYDPFAFSLPEEGFYGNLGRNSMTRPGQVSLDFSVAKDTSIASVSESFTIQFRAEFFNIINRTNLGVPNRDLFTGSGQRSGSAGRITASATTSRQIQLGLKILW